MDKGALCPNLTLTVECKTMMLICCVHLYTQCVQTHLVYVDNPKLVAEDMLSELYTQVLLNTSPSSSTIPFPSTGTTASSSYDQCRIDGSTLSPVFAFVIDWYISATSARERTCP